MPSSKKPAGGQPLRITPSMRRRVLAQARLAIGPGQSGLSVGIPPRTFKAWLYDDCPTPTDDAACRVGCTATAGHRLARAWAREYSLAKEARRAGLSDGVLENASRSVDRALDAGGDLAEIAASGDAAPMAVGISDDGAVVLKPVGE